MNQALKNLAQIIENGDGSVVGDIFFGAFFIYGIMIITFATLKYLGKTPISKRKLNSELNIGDRYLHV